MTMVWNQNPHRVQASQANMQAVVWEKENSRTAGFEDRNTMNAGAGLLRHPQPRYAWMAYLHDQASVRPTGGAEAPLPESTVQGRPEVNSMKESQLTAPPQVQPYCVTRNHEIWSDDELDAYQFKGIHPKRGSRLTIRTDGELAGILDASFEMPPASTSDPKCIETVSGTACGAAVPYAPATSSTPEPLNYHAAWQQAPGSLPTPPNTDSSSGESPERESSEPNSALKVTNSSTASATSTSVALAPFHQYAASQQKPTSLPTPPRTDSSSCESSRQSPMSVTSSEGGSPSTGTGSKRPTYGVQPTVESEGSSPPYVTETLPAPIQQQQLLGSIQPGSVQKLVDPATISSRPIRDKIAQACEGCKKAHAKCSGPVKNGDCTKCQKSGKECAWVKKGSIRKVESQEEIELVKKSLEANSRESRGVADDGLGSTVGKVKRKGSKTRDDNGATVAPKKGGAGEKRKEPGVERVAKSKRARSSPYPRLSSSPKTASPCDIPADNQVAPMVSYPADPILPLPSGQGRTDLIIDHSTVVQLAVPVVRQETHDIAGTPTYASYQHSGEIDLTVYDAETAVPLAAPLRQDAHDIGIMPVYPSYQQSGVAGLTGDNVETAVPLAVSLERQDTHDIAVMPTYASYQQSGMIGLTVDDAETDVPQDAPKLRQDTHDNTLMPTDPHLQQFGLLDLTVENVESTVPPAVPPLRQDTHDINIRPTASSYQQLGMMDLTAVETGVPPMPHDMHDVGIMPTDPSYQQFGMLDWTVANGEAVVPPALPAVSQDMYDMDINLAAPLDIPLEGIDLEYYRHGIVPPIGAPYYPQMLAEGSNSGEYDANSGGSCHRPDLMTTWKEVLARDEAVWPDPLAAIDSYLPEVTAVPEVDGLTQATTALTEDLGLPSGWTQQQMDNLLAGRWL